jgi:hypothetical protein
MTVPTDSLALPVGNYEVDVTQARFNTETLTGLTLTGV